MQYNNAFSESMKRRTDAELIEITTKQRGDFHPEAIEAAELELESRNIDSSTMEIVQQEVSLDYDHKVKRADLPLEFGLKVVCVLFPIIALIFVAVYNSQGYKRRVKDGLRNVLIGIGFRFGIVLVAVAYENLFR